MTSTVGCSRDVHAVNTEAACVGGRQRGHGERPARDVHGVNTQRAAMAGHPRAHRERPAPKVHGMNVVRVPRATTSALPVVAVFFQIVTP